jgi:hypothetical protein
MKRHYEIMRVMRTKVVDVSDLFEGARGILYVQDAILYRVEGLTSVSVKSCHDEAYRVNLIYPSQTTFLSKD